MQYFDFGLLSEIYSGRKWFVTSKDQDSARVLIGKIDDVVRRHDEMKVQLDAANKEIADLQEMVSSRNAYIDALRELSDSRGKNIENAIAILRKT